MSSEHPDPTVYAQQCRATMRRLAHGTRHIENDDDVYCILGSLTEMLGVLPQVLRQLADFHDRAQARASTDGGDRGQGRQLAGAAADTLRAVQMRADHTYEALNEAWSISGRIAWQPAVPISAEFGSGVDPDSGVDGPIGP